jgi:L-ascorbate metabolism protein UlaG (beta-lactamase superfamily)
MTIAIIVLLSLILGTILFLKTARFGKIPSGDSKQKITQSPHYKKNQFENERFTPMMAEGVNYATITWDFFFNKPKYSNPPKPIPSQKTDLKKLNSKDDVLVWFGHSSYFMQLDGKTFLVDPVLSGLASPVPYTTTSFRGSDIYSTDDFPTIDFLFITHDHWDHLDYPTVIKLKSKVKQIITSLGVGSHLRHWGFAPDIITETDWNTHTALRDGFSVHTKPARHFSGRGFTRNQSLWSSFVLKTPTQKIYIGGDSGYDTHFKTIGEEHGPFDLALLECGQYNKNWRHIHMMPEETVQASIDLKARRLMPVHWGKFALSMHDWNEPITRASAEAKRINHPLVTPQIGEPVWLKDGSQQFSNWWEQLKMA